MQWRAIIMRRILLGKKVEKAELFLAVSYFGLSKHVQREFTSVAVSVLKKSSIVYTSNVRKKLVSSWKRRLGARMIEIHFYIK